MSVRTIRRALLSVSDKSGLLDFARGLAGLNVELISTGGTRKALTDAGLTVRDAADVTGFPEMLDGRVKTLHPHIHGGVLAVRDNPEHMAFLKQHGIGTIDLIVCNLYPFEATVARPGRRMKRLSRTSTSAARRWSAPEPKNYQDVAVVTDSGQYPTVMEEMRQHEGALSLETRERLTAAAFQRIASYDQAISAYFARRAAGDSWPSNLALQWTKRSDLRYGENPHQKAAFYTDPTCRRACVAGAQVLHGKELSFNNILDLDSALNLVREFSQPAAVVVKHNNPCGAAVSASLAEAFRKANEGDPVSAYGGVLAFNREVDEATARLATEPNRFIECVIAPGFSEAAFNLFTTRPTWKKNVRLLCTGSLDVKGATRRALMLREVDGGVLVQTPDDRSPDADFQDAKTVTTRSPTTTETADLHFAWAVCKHVKSNAIALAKDGMVVGVGSRPDEPRRFGSYGGP